MNRLYSVTINVYKRIADIGHAIDTLITEPVKDRHMLMVLIHEGAMMNEKLKIGGKLATLVK